MEKSIKNWKVPEPTSNLIEVLQLDDMIHSRIDTATLYSRYKKYGEYPHPQILYKFGVAFLIKGDKKTAKEALMKGASFGLQYPVSIYENPLVDSIGQCLTYLVTQFPNKDNGISMKVTRLAYLYLSKCIDMATREAHDSYRTRAILFNDHENPMVIQSLIMENVGMGALVEPFIISDSYFASQATGSPHQNAYEIAQRIHYNLEDMIIGGEDADDYSLEEMAEFGEKRHFVLFKTIEERFLNGDLNMTFDELQLCV